MTKLPSPLISDIADGRCLPFIGAGFSMNAKLADGEQMPGWHTLTSILAEDAGMPSDADPLAVAERYEQRFGRVQLIEAIRIALHSDEVKPGESQLAFADLPFDTLYTTNFDLLLEDAYTQRARPYRSLVGELQMPFHSGRLSSNIIKMHGDLRHEEHIIVTERDYAQFLKRYPVVATHLSAMLITRTPLFIGYSLSDPDFNNIRKVIRSRLGRFERMAYVIQFDKTDTEIEDSLKDRLHIISLSTTSGKSRDILLKELFEGLRDELDVRAGVSFRASRPDIFEKVEPEIVEKAVQSPDFASILTTTSNLCFVMMPYGTGYDDVYASLIKPVAEEFALEVVRADEITSPGAIIEQIRAAIQQSRLCIADLSDRNPNVLYELGLAQSMGKPTILLSHDITSLPFDVASQRVIRYTNTLDAQSTLRATIQQVLAGDRLDEAQQMIGSGMYRAAIAVLGVILEQSLRSLLMIHIPKQLSPAGLGKMLRIVDQVNIINAHDREMLQQAIQIRNRAVHELAEPSAADAQFVLSVVRDFIQKYGDTTAQTNGQDLNVPFTELGITSDT